MSARQKKFYKINALDHDSYVTGAIWNKGYN